MKRRFRVATATVGLACAMLVGGCQGEDPNPAPTAVLPTPEVPSATPSPSPSEDEVQTQIDDAVAVYSEGRELAERLLVERSAVDVSDALSPYFADSYLGYWEAEFAEFREQSWVTEGAVRLEIIAARGYTASEDGTRLSLLLCSDYSEVSTTTSDGKPVRRGFTYSYDEIVMEDTAERSWKAISVTSEALPALEGSECEKALT